MMFHFDDGPTPIEVSFGQLQMKKGWGCPYGFFFEKTVI